MEIMQMGVGKHGLSMEFICGLRINKNENK
jgi:hypothetical protein